MPPRRRLVRPLFLKDSGKNWESGRSSAGFLQTGSSSSMWSGRSSWRYCIAYSYPVQTVLARGGSVITSSTAPMPCHCIISTGQWPFWERRFSINGMPHRFRHAARKTRSRRTCSKCAGIFLANWIASSSIPPPSTLRGTGERVSGNWVTARIIAPIWGRWWWVSSWITGVSRSAARCGLATRRM